MDQDERQIARALVNELLTGKDDIVVRETMTTLTLHRTGFSAADENTLRGRTVVGKHGAVEIDAYDIEIVVKRRRA